ncbi:type I-E CRISPR-associated endoribonuclease Cas2 [Streptomyces sp. CB01373]|uniref:type I-E CRISPR-associated endoribonuclease Cas2 n=1 Tax=Streptomyces sp. CB01373 TaxID=2020325 RepID=UPI003FA34FD2
MSQPGCATNSGKAVSETVGNGTAVLVHLAPTEQGCAIRAAGTRRRVPADFDGLARSVPRSAWAWTRAPSTSGADAPPSAHAWCHLLHRSARGPDAAACPPGHRFSDQLQSQAQGARVRSPLLDLASDRPMTMR